MIMFNSGETAIAILVVKEETMEQLLSTASG